MQEMQFIECVAERDIDLLFLEELHVSASFRSWLIGQAFELDVCYGQFLGAWHSVNHPTLGESDLVVLFADSAANLIALLIENKIDAIAQPEQGTRYRLRGRVGVDDGSWKSFRTLMTAPQAYLTGTTDAAEYDARLSYEQIRDWFRQSDAADHRSAFRARMLEEAIDQNRRGYRSTPHAAVTKFWSDYWQLACAEFPELRMNKPGMITAGSDWPDFRNKELGRGRIIVHKLARGAVDLQIASAGDAVEEITSRYRTLLTDGLDVVRAGQSASFRLQVPVVDRFAEFSSQVEAVRAGLSAASRLLKLSAHIEVAEPSTDPVRSSM